MNVVRHILQRPVNLRFAAGMSGKSQEITVLHEKDKNRFIVYLEKGAALLDYTINDNTIDLYHTEVPTAYRGHGIAKHLVKDALQYAVDSSFKIKPTCSYVLKYVKENHDPAYDVVT